MSKFKSVKALFCIIKTIDLVKIIYKSFNHVKKGLKL